MNEALERDWPLYAALTAALLVIIPLALFVGRTSGGPAFGLGSPELASAIFLEIRLPRVLLGLLVGGTLGLCGAALQGLLRNPLAEPGLLGASSGAAFGAVLVFYFGLAGGQSLLLPLGAVTASATRPPPAPMLADDGVTEDTHPGVPRRSPSPCRGSSWSGRPRRRT